MKQIQDGLLHLENIYFKIRRIFIYFIFKIYMNKKKDAEKDYEWHQQQEKILKKWAEVSSSYRYLHDRSFAMYSRQNLFFALPVIVLSTITGTANFAQSSFPASVQPYAPAMIGTLNLIAGLITTIAQFLRVSELLESHRVASLAFGKLSRNISVELSLPIKERTTDGTSFLTTCRIELDKLIEQSPNIPINVLSQFDKKFAEHDFIKPDILEITSVDIYTNNDLEEAQKTAQILKLEAEKRKQILEEEEKRKIKAYKEIKSLRKQNKKQTVSAFSVHKSLDKLLSNLNPTEEVQIEIPAINDTSSDTSSSPAEQQTTDSFIQNIEDVDNDQDDDDNTDNNNDDDDDGDDGDDGNDGGMQNNTS